MAAPLRLELPIQTRAARLEPRSVDPEARTVEVVFSTGAEVRRFDYRAGEEVIEELSLDPAHVRLERLNAGAPLLDSHARYRLDDVQGVVVPGSARVDGKRGTALLRFSRREAVEPVFQDVRDGVLRGVSVGYVVHQFRDVTPKGEGVRRLLAVDWEPWEVSLVPVAADVGATVRAGLSTHPCVVVGGAMSEGNGLETRDGGAPGAPAAPTPEVLAERARGCEIRRRGELAGAPLELVDELITRGSPLEEATDRIFEWRAADANAVPMSARISVGADYNAPEHIAAAGAEALASRHGYVPMTERARPFAAMPLLEIARMLLEARGQRTRSVSRSELYTRSMIPHGTSDFPALLGAVSNKVLLAGYGSPEDGIRRIPRPSTAADFKAVNRVRMGEFPSLEKVNEHGEVTHGTIREAKEAYALATFARIVGITRQALVNDDLGAFTDSMFAAGMAARTVVASTLAALVTSNPALGQDGVAVYHATHGNLAGAGGAIDLTTLGTGRAAMRKQKGLDGKTPIDAAPRFLLVSPDKETVAEQYVSQLAPASAANANPFAGRLEVVVDPHLTGNAWYLFADPRRVPSLEYAYLDGAQGPQVETRAGFEIEGVEFKVRLDFGAGWLDYRGTYKNPGA